MDNIIMALNVVFPLLTMMVVGYGIRRMKLVDESTMNQMNSVVFKVFLPMLMFTNISGIEFKTVATRENLKLILFTAVCIFIIVLVGIVVFTKYIPDKKKRSVMIQGIFRSNLVLFGLPVSAAIYGEDHIGIVSVLIMGIVPLFNVFAVILLEVYRGGQIKIKKILIGIIKNPLILGAIAGIIVGISGMDMPNLLLSPIVSMSKVATPLAFVILGATLRLNSMWKHLPYLISAAALKLIFCPAAALIAAYAIGFREEALVALVSAIGSPTAVSSFTMAKEMEADGELAGEIVAFTSILSILTIFFWVLLLKSNRLI